MQRSAVAHDVALGRVNATIDAEVWSRVPSVHAWVRGVAARGDRARARLLLAVRGEVDRDSITAAAAVEMLHLASLVHDDIVDDASERRELPAGHRVLGIGSAILVGNSIAARALEFATTADVFGLAVRGWTRLNEGQLLEQHLGLTGDSDEAAYIRCISLKTAALFEAATGIAARLRRAGADEQRRLAEAGWHFGMAFQLVDDLSDLQSDGARAGGGNSVAWSLPWLLADDGTKDLLGAGRVNDAIEALARGGVLSAVKMRVDRHLAETQERVRVLPQDASDAVARMCDTLATKARLEGLA